MILAKIKEFVKGPIHWTKANGNNIILTVLVALFVLFSFACGYIIAKYQDREPILIENAQ